jgi:RNA polymerase sigma factor (sigma-70 family)
MDEHELLRTLLAEQPKLLAYIRSIVRRQDVADDVFQDVCMLAVEKRAGLHDEGHLLRWLRTTSRLTAMNVMRKRQEEQFLLDAGALDALEEAWKAEEPSNASADAEALRHCLESLSAQHRQLVTRRFVEQHEYAQLAAEYRRTVDSLYVTFSRIYAALAKCISARRVLNPEV